MTNVDAPRTRADDVAATSATDAAALGLVSAGTGFRALAFSIDAAIWTVFATPAVVGAVMLAVGADTTIAVILVAAGWALTVLFGLFQLILHGRRGVTAGKAALRLRSVSVVDWGRPGFWRVVLRALVLWASCIVPLIGPALMFASGLWDRERRGRSILDHVGRCWVIDARAGLDPFDAKALRHARRALRDRPDQGEELPSMASGVDARSALRIPGVRSRAGVVGPGSTGAQWAAGVADDQPLVAGVPAAAAPASVAPTASAPTAAAMPASAPAPSAPAVGSFLGAPVAAPLPRTAAAGSASAPAVISAAPVAPVASAPPAQAAPPAATPRASEPRPDPAAEPRSTAAAPAAPAAPAPHEPAPLPQSSVRADAAPSSGPTPLPSRRAQAMVRFDDGSVVRVPGVGLIGRDPEPGDGERVDTVLRLEDPQLLLSKTHAAFGQEGDVVWVADRGSRNGTQLVSPGGDVVELTPGERTRVPHGWAVWVGGRSFELVARGADS